MKTKKIPWKKCLLTKTVFKILKYCTLSMIYNAYYDKTIKESIKGKDRMNNRQQKICVQLIIHHPFSQGSRQRGINLVVAGSSQRAINLVAAGSRQRATNLEAAGSRQQATIQPIW
jgi:hypothetical protein